MLRFSAGIITHSFAFRGIRACRCDGYALPFIIVDFVLAVVHFIVVSASAFDSFWNAACCAYFSSALCIIFCRARYVYDRAQRRCAVADCAQTRMFALFDACAWNTRYSDAVASRRRCCDAVAAFRVNVERRRGARSRELVENRALPLRTNICSYACWKYLADSPSLAARRYQNIMKRAVPTAFAALLRALEHAYCCCCGTGTCGTAHLTILVRYAITARLPLRTWAFGAPFCCAGAPRSRRLPQRAS